MLDVFKAQLKAKTKAAGVNLSQKRIDAYADRLHKKNPDVKEVAEHDTLIDELDELVSFADVAKEDDRVRTLEAKSRPTTKKKPQEEDDEIDDEETEESSSGKKQRDRTPAWAKALMEKVDRLEGEKRVTSIKEKIAEKLKGKEIPEKFYSKRALPEKEEDLDTFVSEIETDWTELKQENNNLGLAGSSAPASGSGGSKDANVDKTIEAWAGSGKEDTSKK